jgi:hypothetical protein
VLLRENIDSSPVATETSVLTKLSYPIPRGGARTWVTGRREIGLSGVPYLVG